MAADRLELLDSCIRALCALLAFYSNSTVPLQQVEFAALRYVEGQLPLILHEMSMMGKLQLDVDKRLQNAQRDAVALVKRNLASRHKENASCYAKHFLDRPIDYYPEKRSIKSSKRWRLMPEEASRDKEKYRKTLQSSLSEFLQCLSEMDQLIDQTPCDNISQSCLNYLLRERRSLGSRLSGRLFLVTVAQQSFNCKAHLIQLLGTKLYKNSLDAVQLELCSNLFYTLEHQIVLRLSAEKPDALIWMMQLACAQAGFKEFLRITWLLPILHAQHSGGSFVNVDDHSWELENFQLSKFNYSPLATAIALSLLICYVRCLAIADCDTSGGFGRPAVNYDLSILGDGTQVDVDSPWNNDTLLKQFDAISTMQVHFNHVNDVTLYWFLLAVVLFAALTIKLRTKEKKKPRGPKEKI